MKWLENLNLNNLLDSGIFILLCLLGVIGRLSYEVEINKKTFKLSNFTNRLFITSIFTYIIEIFILQSERLRIYYTQIILIFSFFTFDIIEFLLKYKNKIFLYILNIFKKGIEDVSNNINKK